jgi:hypothetical protein
LFAAAIALRAFAVDTAIAPDSGGRVMGDSCSGCALTSFMNEARFADTGASSSCFTPK